MKNNLRNKSFGILGLGISNKAVLEFFISHNYNFILWEDNLEQIQNVAKEINTNYRFDILPFVKNQDEKKWTEIDYLIISPGIPLLYPTPHKLANIATKHNISTICDIELFYLLYPDNKYIGITGTNGKSTITALTHHIIRSVNTDVLIAGNIGKPIFSIQEPRNKIIVLEISSYQIDLLHQTRFAISALSNITPDHIDRHGSFENYINTKYRLISELNDGISIINIDSPITTALYQRLIKEKKIAIPTSTNTHLQEGISILEQVIYDNIKNMRISIPNNPSLVGQHNAQNISLAFAISSSAVQLDIKHFQDSIQSFQGLKHRMQHLATYRGLTFINDSKGTNAISTLYAIEGCKNIFWIVGGIPKEEGIEPLIPFFHNVKHAFIIGQAKEDFAKVFKKYNVPYTISHNLEQAFIDALKEALQVKNTDEITILLSPACASFDQWKNFEERGDAFIKLVNNFITKKDD